ncbi:WXG100 family type VII secretion target [Microbacterium sp. NPDC089695]|uniref:WXG100 family type VII secretion target n=1 Tax=Microbacterium sp. NPDC089695 TaxID=3364198 RepID=UPI003830F7B1
MSVFTVDTDAVASGQSAALATMERLRADAATLTSQLTQLQSTWVGSASNAFQSSLDQWRGAQTHVELSLESLGHSLGAAATQYADADRYSASLFH